MYQIANRAASSRIDTGQLISKLLDVSRSMNSFLLFILYRTEASGMDKKGQARASAGSTERAIRVFRQRANDDSRGVRTGKKTAETKSNDL